MNFIDLKKGNYCANKEIKYLIQHQNYANKRRAKKDYKK